MKRFIAIVLVMILLTSCGTASVADGYETARPSSPYMNINRNGEFYADSQDRLLFIDFDSMQSALMCARPNCTHDDPETCTSYGLRNHPTIIGDKLYFFTTETGWVGDNIATSTRIYRAEIDGSGRSEICYLENLSVNYYDVLLVKGGTAYFIGREEEWDSVKLGTTGYAKSHMCSYNFETRELKDYGIVNEGYSSSVTLRGEYDGGIFIYCTYTEEKIDFLSDDAMEQLMASGINEEYRLDLESGEIAKSELPKLMFVGGGFYGYQDGDNAVVLDSAGNEKVYENYELSDKLTAVPINGFVFNESDMSAIDLENGKIVEISKDALGKYDFVLTYADGEYIVKSELSGEYKKISEPDLFKE